MTERYAASRAAAARASALIPRGVSSAMRADQRPVALHVTRAQGSRMWDLDGHEYVDYVLGFGAAFLGHAPPAVVAAVAEQARHGFAPGAQHAAEAAVAELVVACVPSAEMVAPMTTGSEAVHAAVRLARAATGRRPIVKFAGHYHGWLDPVFVGVPGSPAIEAPQLGGAPGTAGAAGDGSVVLCPFNDVAALEEALTGGAEPVAGVLMEAVPCNFGTFAPDAGYLERARELCDAAGAVLIFDEVITGFRMALGGAQERFGVTPDLTVLSKGIASGMPVAALAGREAVMRVAAGPMSIVGTYNGTPVPLAAARATLTELVRRAPELYPAVDAFSARLAGELRDLAGAHGAPLVVEQIGPVLQLLWAPRTPVRSYADASQHDRAAVARLAELLLDEGVNALARGLWFVSSEHGDEDLERTVAAVDRALGRLGTERDAERGAAARGAPGGAVA
jgi:glutamate-1-semialdehyde 2,1-aminomutase